MNTNTPELLQRISALGASDLFIIAGRPLSYRLNDQVVQDDSERLLPDDTRQLIEDIYHLAGERDMDTLNQTGDDDFSFALPGISRFRVSAYKQRGSLAAVIRIITFTLPSPKEYHSAFRAEQGACAGHRPGRQRKIHHPLLYHRPYQSHPGETYHHSGGSAGISPPP